MRRLVDDVLASGIDVHIVVEVEHRTSILPMVLAGIGHAVVPSSWSPLASGGRARPPASSPRPAAHRPGRPQRGADACGPGVHRCVEDYAAGHADLRPPERTDRDAYRRDRRRVLDMRRPAGFTRWHDRRLTHGEPP